MPAGHSAELHTDGRVWWTDQNSRDTMEPREHGSAPTVSPEEHQRAQAESADLRARLERAEARRFPIMGGPSIPWAMIAPHARQAKQNHDQTLERLAERGGLSPREAVLVLESRPGREWRQMSEAEGLARLTALLAAWESSRCAAEVRRAVEEAAQVVERGMCPPEPDGRLCGCHGRERGLAAAIRARGKE